MYLVVEIVLLYLNRFLKSLQLLLLESILSLFNLFMPAHTPAKQDIPSRMMRPLRKRHSWPPLHHKKHRASYFREEVDEDPFSYFVSDPAESSEAFLSGMAAGIDETPRARSCSPAHRNLLMSTSVPSSPTTRLKKWIERMELLCFHRSPRSSPPIIQRPMPSPEPFRPSTMLMTSSPPVRGRRDSRVGSTHRVTANGRSKPRRPRAWRAPSGDIWTVDEEKEGEDVGLGIEVP